MKNPEKITIVLGVTGSIAAFKACELTSALTKEGFDVHVIMTASACKLICPQSFLTLSRNPVMTDLWEEKEWQPGHIELAMRAKLLVVAPATANILAKMAYGIADDALSTYYISHTGPTIVAPAMNPRMWAHPATQANVALLKERGVIFAGPDSGHVACGEEGPGRLCTIDAIIKQIKTSINIQKGNKK